MDTFMCEICCKQFQKKNQLNHHSRKVHSEARFACNKCNHVCKTKDGVMKHSLIHTDIKPYVCSTCGKAFADNSAWKEHEKYQHPPIDLVIKCERCEKQFRRHKTLKMHKVIHEREVDSDGSRLKFTNEFKLKALQCVAEIGAPKTSEIMKVPYTTLRNWIQNCKSDIGDCPYCGKTLSTRPRLDEHIKTQHVNKQLRKSKLSQSFKEEVLEFANKNSKKDACTKFNLAESTVRNIINSSKNLFECEVCRRKCAYKRQLERHMSEVHNKETIPPKSNIELSFKQYIASENIDTRELSQGLNKESFDSVNPQHIVKLEKKKFSESIQKVKCDLLPINEINYENVSETELEKGSFEHPRILELNNEIKTSLEEEDANKDNIHTLDKDEVDKHNREERTEPKWLNQELEIGKEQRPKFEIGKNISDIMDLTKQSDTSRYQDLSDVEQKEQLSLNINNKIYDEDIENIIEDTDKVIQTPKEVNTLEKLDYATSDKGHVIREEQLERPSTELETDIETQKDIKYDMASNDQKLNKSFDQDETSQEFDAIMLKMKAMNKKEVEIFMDFLTHSEKGLILDELMDDKELFNAVDEYKTEIKEDTTDANQEVDEPRSQGNKNCNISRTIKTHDENMDKQQTEDHDDMIIPGAQASENSHKEFLVNIPRAKTEGSDQGDGFFTEDAASKTYKLVPYKDYPIVVNLKTFGINEESEVIEILSDFIHNEKLIKSAFGKSYRKKKKIFKCSECSKTFRSPCDLKRHMISHTGIKDFHCNTCNKDFTHRHNLDKHTSAYHDDKFVGFLCTHCNKEFKEKAPLVTHLRTHTGEKPYQCSDCEKCFAVKQSLTEHFDIIHEQRSAYKFTCSECAKQFKRSDEFKFHCKTHKDGKPMCRICGVNFTNKSKYNKHMRQHENPDLTFNTEAKCNVCEKTLSSNGNLVRHMMSHTGQKEYVCTICGKAYSDKRAWQSHNEIVHEGTRKFSCDVCSKSFTRYTSLKAHELLHTDQAVFQCQFCPVKYREKRNLMNHIEKLHKKEKK